MSIIQLQIIRRIKFQDSNLRIVCTIRENRRDNYLSKLLPLQTVKLEFSSFSFSVSFSCLQFVEKLIFVPDLNAVILLLADVRYSINRDILPHSASRFISIVPYKYNLLGLWFALFFLRFYYSLYDQCVIDF